jgi:hypothetical protein
MEPERRRAPRVDVNLPARWEGVLTQQEATVTSLSKNGCFLLTAGEVESKELIRIEIKLPDNKCMYFWGEVVDAANEIGFALRFTSWNEEDETLLRSFLVSMLSKTK